MTPPAPLISLDGVSFSYAQATETALSEVSLAVYPGEHVCIVGGNGSGKSTLVQILSVLLKPTAGRALIGGIDPVREPARTLEARRMVAAVFQDPDDQLVTSVVADDVAFGPENLGLPRGEITARVRNALEQLGIAHLAGRDPATLSGGQRQCVAIAGALAMQPQVLVLDEPCAMLDRAGSDLVMRAIEHLNAHGIAVVHVTHTIVHALRADRVIALHAGRIAWEGMPDALAGDADTLRELGIELPFALDLSCRLRERGLAVPPCSSDDTLADALARMLSDGTSQQATAVTEREAHSEHSAPSLVFDHVSFRYRVGTRPASGTASCAVHDVSFALAPGTVTALIGHTGAGKSTVAALACALKIPDTGHVIANGADTAERAARTAVRSTVGYVGQFPERQLFAATVADDIAFGPRNLGFAEHDIEELALRALARSGAHDPARLLDRSPHQLSGGERRTVALAGVLAMDQQILVLDEPGAGLDARAHERFRTLVRELRAEGRTILLITHDMDDAAELADAIAVLDAGQLVALGTPDEVFGNPHITDGADGGLALGMPRTRSFASRLAAYGVGVPVRAYTRDELARELAQLTTANGRLDATARCERPILAWQTVPADPARPDEPDTAAPARGPLANRGRVIGARSPIHLLDPRVKVGGVLVFMASCLAAQGVAALVLAATAVVGLCLIARIPPVALIRQLRPLLLVLAISALVNLLTIDGGELLASWGPIAIHADGADAAVLYSVRFLLMFVAGTLLVLTTTPIAIADGLRSLLSPLSRFDIQTGEAAMAISIALRFVPILARDARDIADAQTARGAGLSGRGPLAFVRACIPMATPLFTSALRHAEHLGRAMDARCYTGDEHRTSWHRLRLEGRDRAAIAISLVYLAALTVLSLM